MIDVRSGQCVFNITRINGRPIRISLSVFIRHWPLLYETADRQGLTVVWAYPVTVARLEERRKRGLKF